MEKNERVILKVFERKKDCFCLIGVIKSALRKEVRFMEKLLTLFFQFVDVMPLRLAFVEMLYMCVSAGVVIALYVVQSVGLYTIAKRRRIRHPWLSWIPVGSTWILGSISDQYQYLVKGKIKNKRKTLLLLQGILCVMRLLILVFSVVLLVRGIGLRADPYVTNADVIGLMGILVCLLWSVFLSFALQIAVSVISYMALFNLYSSCNPINDVIFLLLSIFIDFAQPILVFICRGKDLGMPKRKVITPEPEAESEPEEGLE